MPINREGLTLKKTVGAASRELSLKEPDAKNAIDQMREQLTDYDKNIHECLKEQKKNFDGDFYVVVLTKKERLMQNVLRGYFFGRLSCPTPDYDQAVYKYNRADDNLVFLWVIPSYDVVNYMKNNVSHVPKEKYALLDYVLRFVDGTLTRLAKELNGEKKDSILLQ